MVTVKKSLTSVLKLASIAATVSLTSLAVAPQAHAALLHTSSAAFTRQITDLESSNPDLTLTLSKYNPLLGVTVDQVVVTLAAEIENSGSITNTSPITRIFTVTSQLTEFTVSPNTGAPTALVAFNPFSASPNLVSQTFTLAQDSTATFNPPIMTDTSSQTFENTSDISQFLGSGTFSFSPSAFVSTTFTGSGNAKTQINTLASVRITVDYYGEENVSNTQVPEASATLGIIGLAGAAFVSKKLGAWQKSVS